MKMLSVSAMLLLALTLTSLTACSNKAEPAATAAGNETSPLIARVTDDAHILTQTQKDGLTKKLAQLEQRTGHQMVVVTVPGLNGRNVADVARDIGNRWGIGRAEQDDGVILLVAPSERKIRIAVGYGLEKVLTDERCKRIIDQDILPHFRKGDLANGVEQGVDALIAALL